MADKITLRLTIDGDNAGGRQAIAQLAGDLKGLGVTAAQQGQKIASSGKALGTFAADVKRELHSLAGELVALVGAKKFLELGVSALDTAREIGRLSQETGIAVETLSVFNRVAKQSDLDLTDLATGLRGLSNKLQQVQQGNDQAAQSFEAIGLSGKELAALPLDQAIFRVADALQAFRDGANKAAVVNDLFGVRALRLIPVLNALSGEGFAKARTEAERYGQIVREQDVRAAEDLERSTQNLKAQVQNLAREFLSGLIPGAVKSAQALDQLTGTADDTASGFQRIGEAVGAMLKGIVFVANVVATAIVTPVLLAVRTLETIGKTLGALAAGSLKEAKQEVKEGFADIKSFLSTAVSDSKDLFRELFPSAGQVKIDAATARDTAIAELKVTMAKLKAAGAEVEPIDISTLSTEQILAKTRELENDLKRVIKFAAADRIAIAKAELDARLALLDLELAKVKATTDQREAAFTASFEQGRLSLKAFFAGRRQLLQEEGAAELATARAKVAELAKASAAADTRGARSQEAIAARAALLTAQNQLALIGIQLQTRENALTAEEVAKRKDLVKTQGDFARALAEAQGRQFDAARIGIEQQITEFRASLAKLGLPSDEVEQLLADFRTAATAKATFDELSAASDRLGDSIARNAEQLGLQVNQGLLTADQATVAQNRFVASQVGTVNSLLQSFQALREAAIAAHADPAIIAGMDAQIAKLLAIADATTQAKDQTDLFAQRALEGFGQSIVQFFDDATDRAKSFSEAITDMARNILRAIANIAAQILALEIITAIAKAAGVPVPEGGFHLAEGGPVPGHGRGDIVPAMLEPGEFVLSRRMLQQLGGLRGLAELLDGLRITPPLRRGGVTRFAEGGFVSPRGGEDGFSAEAVIGLEEGLVLKHLRTRGGRDALMRFVQENARAISGTLGRGA